MATQSENGTQTMKNYFEAMQPVNSWVAGARALVLLQACLESGILHAALNPVTLDELAARTHLEPGRLSDICRSLVAYGIFNQRLEEDKTYVLTQTFARLISPLAFRPLGVTLDGARVMLELLEAALGDVGQYTTLSPRDRLSVARSVTAAPDSPELIQVLADSFRKVQPELTQLFMAGARHLELGSGVAGLVRTLLQIFPALKVVAVEQDADLLAFAQQSSVEQGISERVEWRLMDAAKITDQEVFDSVFWSQGFFPEDSRQTVLSAAYRALRPGGYLYAPLGPVFSVPDDILHTADGQNIATGCIIYKGWGIPERSAAGLQAELEGVGFQFVRMTLNPVGQPQGVLVQRP